MTNLHMPDEAPAPLTPETLDVILAAICTQAGLDSAGARLIKFTNNAVLELKHEPVIVRIAGSQTVRDRVPKVIAVARWLAERDMPAVRLLPDIDQPIEAHGHVATFWQRVPATGPAPSGADLGRILRRYHSLAPPCAPLPLWRPLAAIRQRIAETDALADNDRAFLLTKCDELEEAVDRLSYDLPPGPIHGDSFLGNLIPAPDGPVICDYDSAADGPREWDLTPIAVGKLRFAYPGRAHEELAESYGVDITRWSGFAVFRQLRELQLVTSVLPVLRSNQGLAEQWNHRLKTFRNGDIGAVWTPYR